jgi:glycerophosphoryl diester phosphodiesterase
MDADLVEVDVQRSRDGALVLVHDTTLARTTDAVRRFPRRAPWHVADFTYDELRWLDAGSWKSADFAGERIPTLEEAVEVIRRSGSGLLLEVKAPELHPGIAPEVVGALRAIPGYVDTAVRAGRLVVQSFDAAAMKAVKAEDPALPVGLLGTPSRATLPALGSWADQVNPSHFTVDRAYVAEVHRHGLACLVWTVDRGPAIRRAVRMGVDGVITNRPDVVRRIVSRASTSEDWHGLGSRFREAGGPDHVRRKTHQQGHGEAHGASVDDRGEHPMTSS